MSGLIPEGGAEGGPLLPPDWQELAPLIDAVLDAEPAQRTALIVELSEGNPARERALADMVAECARDAPLLSRLASERFAGLAAETDSVLPELLGDRYRVGRELGRGGMARVYLARDLKHNRDVAIKVIRPELSASLGHDRFLREIGIAARLRHPNIVPLYDSGEVGESLYFVMPYEEGPSLRERLVGAGPLTIADAVNVLRDVARALAYAHEHGVVHRDVKPDNVMLSGGAAVVTDFGIAKAVSAALTDVSGPTLTQLGSAIGTPAYMAPEQATGDPSTDHRADIYSFGCLAYELFTGKPPFAVESMHLVIAAHLGTVPQPVTMLRAEVPPPVSELLARCLEKHPSARPQSAREVLDSLEGAATASYPTPISATVQTLPSRARVLRWTGLALLAGVIVAGAYFATRGPASSPPIKLSLLPLGNSNADSAISYMAQGLPDELAIELMRVPGIQIMSRSGARYYQGQLGVDVTEAGARLGADYLTTGMVRQEDGQWILSLELERAADKASLWGDRFIFREDRSAGAALEITDKLTTALRSLFPNSIGTAPARAANQRTENNEAHRLYLKGRERLSRRTVSVKESAELFRAAIHLDSLYAVAYSGLSVVLALSPFYEGVSPKAVRDELVEAARRALDLDSTLAEPHAALGLGYWFDYQWQRAESEFKTAIQLEPRNVEARVHYARFLIVMGRHRDALQQLRSARGEDPASAVVLSWMAFAYYIEGQADSALVESRRALENDSSLSARDFGARMLLHHNRPAEARKLIASTPPWFWVKGYLLAKAGDPAAARRLLQEWDAAAAQPWYVESRRALTYLGLGDTALALSALERADARGETWAVFAGPSDPVFASIRRSARYRALLRKVGLEH